MTSNSRWDVGELVRLYVRRLAILSPVILVGVASIGLNLLLFGFILPEFLGPAVVVAGVLSGVLVVVLVLPPLLGVYPSVSALVGYRLAIVMTFIPLVAVVVGVVVFVIFGYQISEVVPRLDFSEALQEGWEHIRTYRLDTNLDGEQEWVVLYRFDLPVEGDKHVSPVGAAVYQRDDQRPANFQAHPLLPKDRDYLCECTCVAAMENVLSGLEGPELVVRDECYGKTTRVSIFHWDPKEKKYLPKGHFLGGSIQLDTDVVTVDEPQPGRAQLAMRGTYYPDSEQYYGVKARRKELVFSHGEPKDVMYSPYPEKVLLAFYNHYNDDEKAPEYFAESVRAYLGQCDAGGCGCIAPRREIAHVRVTELGPEFEFYSPDKDVGPDRATVGVTVICERRDGVLEPARSVRWYLVREDGCWRLEHPE